MPMGERGVCPLLVSVSSIRASSTSRLDLEPGVCVCVCVCVCVYHGGGERINIILFCRQGCLVFSPYLKPFWK